MKKRKTKTETTLLRIIKETDGTDENYLVENLYTGAKSLVLFKEVGLFEEVKKLIYDMGFSSKKDQEKLESVIKMEVLRWLTTSTLE